MYSCGTWAKVLNAGIWAVVSGCHGGRGAGEWELAGGLGDSVPVSLYVMYCLQTFSLWDARGGTQDPMNTRHVLLLSSTPSPDPDSQPALSIPESFISGTPVSPLYTSIGVQPLGWSGESWALGTCSV